MWPGNGTRRQKYCLVCVNTGLNACPLYLCPEAIPMSLWSCVGMSSPMLADFLSLHRGDIGSSFPPSTPSSDQLWLVRQPILVCTRNNHQFLSLSAKWYSLHAGSLMGLAMCSEASCLTPYNPLKDPGNPVGNSISFVHE